MRNCRDCGGFLRALAGCGVALFALLMAGRVEVGRADDGAAAADAIDASAAKRAALAQKIAAQQKISAVLRARRAQNLRSAIAYDDVYGAGASNLALAMSANWLSAANGSSGNFTAFGATSPWSTSLLPQPGTATGIAGNSSNGTGTGNSGACDNSSQGVSASIGSKIVQFAQKNLGQKVGNGESRALIDAALSYAGAKPASQNVFGDVISVSSAQPGDIVQFENAIFLGMNYWMIMGTPNQSAIVYMIRGNEAILLDQDVNGIQLVQYTTINLADLHRGTITAYRAVAGSRTKRGLHKVFRKSDGHFRESIGDRFHDRRRKDCEQLRDHGRAIAVVHSLSRWPSGQGSLYTQGMAPLTYIAASRTGRGLFAGEPIAAGACILQFSGPILTLNETRSKGADAANALQVGINRYLYLDEPGRFVNHSCAPNAAVVGDTRLVAIRPIAAKEEIRFDYSTTVSDGWTMECRCGSTECRGLIVAFQLLPDSLRRRYSLLGHVQRFIVEQVGA